MPGVFKIARSRFFSFLFFFPAILFLRDQPMGGANAATDSLSVLFAHAREELEKQMGAFEKDREKSRSFFQAFRTGLKG